jgi:hypothetical protein
MNINGICQFVTKERWFNQLYTGKIKIQQEVNIFNMLEYQRLIKKIKKLELKQQEEPIQSREELIQLKNIQKEIFKKQLGIFYSNNALMRRINNNPDIFLSRSTRISDILLKKKIGLLTGIFEMERAICQLEFMRDITIQRDRINLPVTRADNAKSPVTRKLFNDWAKASNLKIPNTTNDVTLNYTNELFRHPNNKKKMNEFKEIFKNAEKDNFDLHMRIKKDHLKTKRCKFMIQPISSPQENSEFLQELESREVIPWQTLLELLGVNSLPFLNQNPEHKRAIIELFNLYLMPITEPFDDIFRLKREYYLMCISFILYDFNTTSMNYLPESEGTSGFTAQTRTNRNSLYKVEDLLMKKYPKRSYMSSVYLFSFFIQKYLHSLNSSYVPDIKNIFFHFTNERKSITKMNLAGRNRNRITYSMDLYQLLTKPIIEGVDKYFFEINYFLEFFIEVLKKLCKILIFYQEECYFVHRDLHTSNIMINFNLIGNQRFDLSNIEVKLIDFTYSSIVINNREGQNSEFMNTNYNYFFDIKLSNPYLNKDWNKYDLKYLFISLLLQKIYKGDMELLNENILINRSINQIQRIRPIKKIKKLLIDIFNIKPDYLQSYKLFKSDYIQRHNTQKCIVYDGFTIEGLTYRELLFNNDILKNIMGDNFRFDLLNPTHLLNSLNKKIN